jgi:hypothetical protein
MDDAAATLFGKAPSRVIDQSAPHFSGHQAEKGLAIFYRSRSFAQKAQIRFVQEGRGLEGMALALAPEMGVGDPTQLVVGRCDDFFTGCCVSASPRVEEL